MLRKGKKHLVLVEIVEHDELPAQRICSMVYHGIGEMIQESPYVISRVEVKSAPKSISKLVAHHGAEGTIAILCGKAAPTKRRKK